MHLDLPRWFGGQEDVPCLRDLAQAIFGEVFGQAAGPALAAALPPDQDGWRVVTLSFEHERAAAHRLAGFGDQVEVLTPPSVQAGLVATARQIMRRYHAADD